MPLVPPRWHPLYPPQLCCHPFATLLFPWSDPHSPVLHDISADMVDFDDLANQLMHDAAYSNSLDIGQLRRRCSAIPDGLHVVPGSVYTFLLHL